MPKFRTIQSSGFTELRAAITVAECLSFRAAADALGMSATALSSNVRMLENRLGIRLFNRTTRSVSLTSAGEEFIRRVAPSLNEIERAMDAAGSHGTTPSGTLRINSSVTAAHEILSPLLRDYLGKYPDVHVEVTTETRLVDVVLEGCDVGIRLAESIPADMVAVPLPFNLDFCVVGSPEYLDSNPAPQKPADLIDHACIKAAIPNGSTYRWEFEEQGRAHAVEVHGSLTLDDQNLMLKAALDGMGLAYISKAVAREAVDLGRLRYVLDDWMPKHSRLCLYYPRNRNPSAALRALISQIRAEPDRS
ncbi:LysR family transcriptional regulator [Rhizobium sp. Root708]|uniref:LysR family transcriptional regulator n=1 Tax=Rhizobium sp. Root708 TaxID=1736592 RepID=UPI0006F2048C|nr:LysR family transcriptional regulator [Rhizobium sp. Root708]KRB51335.1 LysR family transcriptional regulator [Rhizobium sp. Root708]